MLNWSAASVIDYRLSFPPFCQLARSRLLHSTIPIASPHLTIASPSTGIHTTFSHLALDSVNTSLPSATSSVLDNAHAASSLRRRCTPTASSPSNPSIDPSHRRRRSNRNHTIKPRVRSLSSTCLTSFVQQQASPSRLLLHLLHPLPSHPQPLPPQLSKHLLPPPTTSHLPPQHVQEDSRLDVKASSMQSLPHIDIEMPFGIDRVVCQISTWALRQAPQNLHQRLFHSDV